MKNYVKIQLVRWPYRVSNHSSPPSMMSSFSGPVLVQTLGSYLVCSTLRLYCSEYFDIHPMAMHDMEQTRVTQNWAY